MATSCDRQRRRRHGEANYRICRYADDFVIMVSGTKAHAEGLRDEVAAVLAPMGLRLSEEKTTVVHIDKGFIFLGFRIQRQPKRGSNKCFVYTWPSKKALASICLLYTSESAPYLHCTVEFAQLTRLDAADVRSTDRCAVNPACLLYTSRCV